MKKILVISLLFVTITISARQFTEKNQSVTLNILGAQYNYEHPLSSSTTVKLHGGFSGDLGFSSGSFYMYEDQLLQENAWHYAIRSTVGANFRYYYNLQNRSRKGKSIRNNSGNFLAVDFQYHTPGFYVHNMKTQHIGLINPHWGHRRVYSTNWLFEFTAGMITGVIGKDFGWSATFDFKIGYCFR